MVLDYQYVADLACSLHYPLTVLLENPFESLTVWLEGLLATSCFTSSSRIIVDKTFFSRCHQLVCRFDIICEDVSFSEYFNFLFFVGMNNSAAVTALGLNRTESNCNNIDLVISIAL